MRAENKSRETIKNYTTTVRAYIAWCERECVPADLDRNGVTAFVAHVLDTSAVATGVARQLGVRRFSAWLTAEGVIDSDPLLGLRAPKLDQPVVPKLSDYEIGALLRACSGRTFPDRRDEALVRMALDTTARADELLAMQTDRLDMKRMIAVIERGKGGRGRVVPFTAKTAQVLDRYLRMRAGHALADTPALWLGERGHEFAYSAFRKALLRRAKTAGIRDFHPHRLRHTAASRWLAAGGSEGGLMAIAGWQSRDMINRYTSDTAMERAVAEARRLNLGNTY